jgi:uncharacterized RDD family membrane protein YckC
MGQNRIKILTRFFNFIIDSILFTIIAIAIVSILVRYHPAFKVYNPQNNRILAFILYFLYYFLFEIAVLSTPGKIITKTKVSDNRTFTRPSILKIFIRTLCRFIPFEALSIFLDENNLTWHDKISKTTVIKIA